jgi:hypothetical protein
MIRPAPVDAKERLTYKAGHMDRGLFSHGVRDAGWREAPACGRPFRQHPNLKGGHV